MRAATIAASFLLLQGCTAVQSTFNTHGPAAERISRLSWLMTILFILVTIVMWILLTWAFVKRRGTLSEHAPIDQGGGQAWIAIGGLAIPLIVLTVIFVLGLQLLTAFPIHGMSGHNMQMSMKPSIRIVGHQWWWEVQYLDDDVSRQFTTANEIHIPAGQGVNIELQTRDVMHSFWVPSLHGKVDLIPGRPNYIRIEASSPGEYVGQCAEYCGAQHAHMRLLVVAQIPDEFERWRKHQLEDSNSPATQDEVAGQTAFLSHACVLCHTIRGTSAGGSVAPDLTHLASRRYIAGNSLPNNTAYLEAWATHAQSLKPECQMPDLAVFTGEELRQLVAYLRQLQ